MAIAMHTPNHILRSTFRRLAVRWLGGVLLIGVLCSVFVPLVSWGQAHPPATRELRVLVVVGAEGTQEYGRRYREEAAAWVEVCRKAGVSCEVVGLTPVVEGSTETDSGLLKAKLEKLATQPKAALWLILIGHGTFDGRDARFNLRRPDFTPQELALWMKPFTGEVACIQTASASAPFVKALAGRNRVLISATKSADEVFYTRFGQFFVKAISGSQEADLDRDEQVSLLEAFLWASRQVQRFFETEQRLATEHAILEDNGDGTGTRAEDFQGTRLAQSPAEGATPEGVLAHQWSLLLSESDARLTETQRQRRNALEREIEALKARRQELGDEMYYRKLEVLLLEIAGMYGDDKGG